MIPYQVNHQACHNYILQRIQLENPDKLLHKLQVLVHLQFHMKIPFQFHILIPVRHHEVNHQAFHNYILQRSQLKNSAQLIQKIPSLSLSAVSSGKPISFPSVDPSFQPITIPSEYPSDTPGSDTSNLPSAATSK